MKVFSEKVIHEFLAKYKSEEGVYFYNSYVREHVMEGLDILSCVHILDCTMILVNLDNYHYKNSFVVKHRRENNAQI